VLKLPPNMPAALVNVSLTRILSRVLREAESYTVSLNQSLSIQPPGGSYAEKIPFRY
jgi:hypothetical protein